MIATAAVHATTLCYSAFALNRDHKLCRKRMCALCTLPKEDATENK